MAKSLLKQPETLCSERPPTILDVEGKMKREKKDLRVRTINHLILRISPRARKLQKKNLKTFPSNTLALLNNVQSVPKTTTTKIITHTRYEKTLMNLLVKQ